MSNEIDYEDEPWGDDAPLLGRTVSDLLPPPNQMVHSVFRIQEGDQELFMFPKDDLLALSDIASRKQMKPEVLLAALIQDYIAEHR